MSEFEKRFPEPKVEYKNESQNFIDTMNILYRKKREGWIEHGKHILNLIKEKGYSKAWLEKYIEDEIGEIENEKTT